MSKTMEDGISLTFCGQEKKAKITVRISGKDKEAWLENELGEKVSFGSAEELTNEIYRGIETVFLSRKKRG